jgi:hypothetical protein
MEAIGGCLFYFGNPFTGQFVVEVHFQVDILFPGIYTCKSESVDEMYTCLFGFDFYLPEFLKLGY